jgi:hypothetical protein
MSSIDTGRISQLMRRTRADRTDAVDQRESAIDTGIAEVAEVIRQAKLGNAPPPQDHALYGGRPADTGQRIAAAHSGLQDFVAKLDEDHKLLVDEMAYHATLIEQSQKRHAEMEEEAAGIAAMRDGARELLGQVPDEAA